MNVIKRSPSLESHFDISHAFYAKFLWQIIEPLLQILYGRLYWHEGHIFERHLYGQNLCF